MNKDFLSISELSKKEVFELLDLTDSLKTQKEVKPLAGKTVAMIFQKPSLRTRVSFEVGVVQLGGHAIFLTDEGVGLGVRESAADVANVLSRFNDAIVARVFNHQLLLDLAKHATIPVINALSDLTHPCQILADLYTIRQHGKLRDHVKVAYVGDGNNIVNSWLELASIIPIHLTLAIPFGYEPDTETLNKAVNAKVSKIEIIRDPRSAVNKADVVYTDTWTSMGQEQEKTKRIFDFWEYQVNGSLLRQAKKDVIVMHCLPAHRGEEITDEALDGPQSVVNDQAENRLHIQKAIMATLIGKKK
ncbi:MAG: ornithine carbamoyltransferase [Bacteroidetes bacterium]|nr:ornithine carbamoyltransferase [Bacteroidota bacterium]